MSKAIKHSHSMHFKQIEMLLEGAIERHVVYQDSSINTIVRDAQELHGNPMKISGINKEYLSYSLPLSGTSQEVLMKMDSSRLSIEDYKVLLGIFRSL